MPARDLDTARDELSQCQYADTIDQFPLEVHWTAEVPALEKLALLFQSNMAEIGIPVNITRTPWLNILDEIGTQESSSHFYTLYIAADMPDAGVMLQQLYHSSTANTWMQNAWLLDPELDAAIDASLSTTDEAERVEMYQAIQQDVMEIVPSLFLFDWIGKQAYQADVIDWQPEEQSAVIGYTLFMPRIGVTR